MSAELMNKKLEYWQHKLLDLGKRNKMLNYRKTKRTTIRLTQPSFTELFTRLAVKEETLTFRRAVDRETDIRVFSFLLLLENLSAPLPVTVGDIETESALLERQKTLRNLRAKAKLALEEQGTNILYLSFGFLEWKDAKATAGQWYTAPLILMPAVLSLESLQSPYTLKKQEDDIVVNPTLEYFLLTEYGIRLPQFDADKDSIDDFMKQVEEMADQRGWRVVKEANLGLLSFLKISMYNDLIRNADRIRSHPVIRAMAGEGEQANDIPAQLQDMNPDDVSPHDCYQVMSADSSQQDAILYSKSNISFVMQGPPGTGKSQTITNIIAEALAEGKKVLFVSEKQAALQVVYRRLQEAHLGEFCLPLHSYRANKKKILEQLGANLHLKQTRVNDVALSNLEELQAVRRELNDYAQQLHALNPDLCISCYEVYSRLEEVNSAPAVSFAFEDPTGVSQPALQACLHALDAYSLAVERLDRFVRNNPWEGLSSRTTGFEYAAQMTDCLTEFTDSLRELEVAFGALTDEFALRDCVPYASAPALADYTDTVCALPQIPTVWVGEYDALSGESLAMQTKNTYERLAVLRENVASVFTDAVYRFDYNGWQQNLLNRAAACRQLPLLRNLTADRMVADCVSLSAGFENLADAFADAQAAMCAINEKMGTAFAVNGCGLQSLAELAELLAGNVILNRSWFSAEPDRMGKLLLEAQAICAQIRTIRENLLLTWEPEVLEFDYAPVLVRYKTDYTSKLRMVNSNYRQDKKALQALSRAVIKKLPDDVAFELLTTLKEYHDKLNRLREHEAELSTVAGLYYNGVDTDWTVVASAVRHFLRLQELFGGNVPAELIGLVTRDHAQEAADIRAFFSALEGALEKAEAVIAHTQADMDVRAETFDIAQAAEAVQVCLQAFDEIRRQASLLQPYLVNENEPMDSVYCAIGQLNAYTELCGALEGLTQRCAEQFEHLFAYEDTQWDALLSLLHRADELKKEDAFGLFPMLVNRSEAEKAVCTTAAACIRDVWQEAEPSFTWLQRQFSAQTQLSAMTVTALAAKMNGCLEHMDMLEKWIDYQEAKDGCAQVGLADFLEKTEEGQLFDQIKNIFLRGFYYMWLDCVFETSVAVRRLRRNTQDARIQRFAELDDRQLLIAQMRIREKLIADLPSAHRMLKATDEVAVLNKELGKKRNLMPLRKLFRMIPNLLMKLKPCLMMSPLSVAYFLEAESYHFDLVIFDEASQIFPEDAIGAIFRGSQVIITGDSKQLPPTDFFTATTNNFDNDFDSETQEEDGGEVVADSILEEAVAVLPSRTLLWHYRSKHESLIAFSNREIYRNSLITFPNCVPCVPDMGVEYVYVEDGIYDRSGKRNNSREAEECVRLVFEHIEKYPDRSLGIIAFSESQQATIENAIIDYRERNPSYEWFFDESREEPFFVKNLENVQGDERDTIIFSICYGRDKSGVMHMNFGPVGHTGGERRLNVAVTRAKCNVKLVGSILPADIDLQRTKAEGVRMLRSYIEYAIEGTDALRPVESSDAFEEEDRFLETVAHFLTENGWSVERRVGCSDYKIDIAVRNPEAQGEFIAAVECDGYSYIHAGSARDRDHLRGSVLRKMGWNLYRVWSTEWFRNPEAEGKALLDFLTSLSDTDGKVPHTVKGSHADDDDTADILADIASETEDVPAVTDGTAHTQNPYGFLYYSEADWKQARHSAGADNITRICENILHIVSIEQPIHMELLYKRMAASFTVRKATDSVKRTIDILIAQKLTALVTVDADRFVRMVPASSITVRMPKNGTGLRPIEYIHTQEIAAAMMKIAECSVGITQEDLASECARVFGFERKGPKIKTKTDAALQWLQENGKVRIVDGKVLLPGE